jgi:hypothetical protein
VIIAGVVVATWLLYLIIPIATFGNLEFKNWLPFSSLDFPLKFQLDQSSWQIAFLMASLLLGGVLSSVIDIPNSNASKSWPACMLVTAIGLLAVSSNDPISLVIAWTILDFFEIVLATKNLKSNERKSISNLRLTGRLAGTLIVIWAFAINLQGRKIPGFEILSPQTSVLVLLAVFLRTMSIERDKNQNNENHQQQAHSTIQYLISTAASLCLLIKVPKWPSAGEFLPEIIILLLLFALLNAYRWFRSSEPHIQRQTLTAVIFSAASLGVLTGNSSSTSAWIGLLLADVGFIYLYTLRNKRLLWLGIITCISISGIPFTPFSSIWMGFSSFNLRTLLLAMIIGFTLAGFIKIILKNDEEWSKKENWIQVIYPFGLSLLIVSQFLIWLKVSPVPFVKGFWPAGLIVAGTAITITVVSKVASQILRRTNEKLQSSRINQQAFMILQKVVGLKWLAKILESVIHLIQSVTGYFSNILEGEGGLFWSILLLVLILTMLKIGGK